MLVQALERFARLKLELPTILEAVKIDDGAAAVHITNDGDAVIHYRTESELLQGLLVAHKHFKGDAQPDYVTNEELQVVGLARFDNRIVVVLPLEWEGE